MNCSLLAQARKHQVLPSVKTINALFMTSGHGGCHPLGLAFAAKKGGFNAQVLLNTRESLFIDGVRSEKKKAIMHTVHNQFVKEVINQQLDVKYQDFTLEDIAKWLAADMAILILISTYRFDGKKSPHWVCITHLDEHCLYVHDPFCETEKQLAIDCQHVPISRADFLKMATFGSNRLKTAIALSFKG